MPELITIEVGVVHSDPDMETLTGDFKLRSPAEAAKMAAEYVADTILQKVPTGRVCSVVLGKYPPREADHVK